MSMPYDLYKKRKTSCRRTVYPRDDEEIQKFTEWV